jgi:hypothetical protein
VILECPGRSAASGTAGVPSPIPCDQITEITSATGETASPTDRESRLIELPAEHLGQQSVREHCSSDPAIAPPWCRTPGSRCRSGTRHRRSRGTWVLPVRPRCRTRCPRPLIQRSGREAQNRSTAAPRPRGPCSGSATSSVNGGIRLPWGSARRRPPGVARGRDEAVASRQHSFSEAAAEAARTSSDQPCLGRAARPKSVSPAANSSGVDVVQYSAAFGSLVVLARVISLADVKHSS